MLVHLRHQLVLSCSNLRCLIFSEINKALLSLRTILVTISFSVETVIKIFKTTELNQYLKIIAEHLLNLSQHLQKTPNGNFTFTLKKASCDVCDVC